MHKAKILTLICVLYAIIIITITTTITIIIISPIKWSSGFLFSM